MDIKNYTVASLTKILILMHGIFTLKTTITCYSVVKNRIGINKNIKLPALTFLEYINAFIHISSKKQNNYVKKNIENNTVKFYAAIFFL